MGLPRGSMLRTLLVPFASVWLSVATAQASAWTASVDERDGLPTVSLGGAKVVSGAFVFWRKDWAWAEMTTALKIEAPYTITGRNEALGLDLSGRIRKASEHQLVWEFN